MHILKRLHPSQIFILLSFFLWIQCPTIDPPPPAKLSAPAITEYKIYAKSDYSGEYHEFIKIIWRTDSSDQILTDRFNIIREIDNDSFPTVITNIPGTNTEFDDDVNLFNIMDRTVEHRIYYHIYGYDTLDRSGDTSVACTLVLARNLILMHPGDTMKESTGNEYFQWEVPEQISDPNISQLYLWRGDSLVWKSDSIRIFSMGRAQYLKKKLPSFLSPLQRGKYYWGIEFSIIETYYPMSITIRNFTVE